MNKMVMVKKESNVIEKLLAELMGEHENEEIGKPTIIQASFGRSEDGWYCEVVTRGRWTQRSKPQASIQDAYLIIQHYLKGTEVPPF